MRVKCLNGQTGDGRKNVDLKMTGAKMAALLDKKSSPLSLVLGTFDPSCLSNLTGDGQLRGV